MSSESDLISTIVSAQTYLYRLGGPILMFIGNISSIFNLIIFTRKNLRKNPCSIYLIAFNIINFLFLNTTLLQATLFNGFNINLISYNLTFCRFITYIGFLWDILSPFYLVLASVDRVLVTSRNALTRRRSTHRLAYICIISGTIFWMLFHIHALILMDIIEIYPNYFICYFFSNSYLQFTSYYSLILKAIIIPLLMIVFGLRAVKNVRTIGRVQIAPALPTNTATIRNALNPIHSKDRQLVKILIINISVYLIFSLMLSIVLMYQQITQYETKSSVQSQIDLFLLFVSLFSSYIPFCIVCYTNFFMSKTFRIEIKKIILCQ